MQIKALQLKDGKEYNQLNRGRGIGVCEIFVNCFLTFEHTEEQKPLFPYEHTNESKGHIYDAGCNVHRTS